jgi:hypothetical protein
MRTPLLHALCSPLEEGNPFGTNWRSPSFPGSGDLGTGKVSRPDAPLAAKDWKKEGGKTKTEWEEYAKRMGIFPADIQKGWDSLEGASINTTAPAPKKVPPGFKPYSGSPVGDVLSRARFGESFLALRAFIGEATSWWGYSVPNLAMLKTPVNPGPGFGFHTKSAEEVWRLAKVVADENPKEKTVAIIGKAVDRAKVLNTELTPEDMKMLEMAVNWYLAGKSAGMEQPTPPSNGNKTAGARGDAATPSRSFV